MLVKVVIMMMLSVVWGYARADIVSSNASVTRAANGAEVVNIVPPNADGASQNIYSKFNVDSAGAAFNNGVGASLIINEVFGPRSMLNGPISVIGPGANVVIANQSGITCNGCGFINIPRATLTSGTPVYGASGLERIDITNGDVTVGDATADGRLEVIARTAAIVGQVSAPKVKALVGGGSYDYASDTFTSANMAKEEVVLDAAWLGATYSDTIYIVANENGVGMNAPSIAAQEIEVTADGEVRVSGAALVAKDKLNIKAGKVMQIDESYIASGVDAAFSAPLVDIASSLVEAEGNIMLSGVLLKGRLLKYQHMRGVQVGDPKTWRDGTPGTEQGYTDYEVRTYEDTFEPESDPTVIRAKGLITADFNKVETTLSHMLATDIDFKDSMLVNQNINLYRKVEEKSTVYPYVKVKKGDLPGQGGKYANVWTAPKFKVTQNLIEALNSAIAAKNKIVGKYVTNGGSTDIAAIEDKIGLAKMRQSFGLDNRALFTFNEGGRHLYETKAALVDPSKYISSDVAFPWTATLNKLGDSYAENNFIKMQALYTYGVDAVSVADLYANATAYANSTGKNIGDPLTAAEISALQNDIVWMEWEDINGQMRFVPRLYMARSAKGASISAANVEFGKTTNYGTIEGSDKVEINGDLANYGAVAGKRVDVNAANVLNSALLDRYTYANGYYDIAGTAASIIGETVNIKASEDMYNIGSSIESTISTGVEAKNIHNSALAAASSYVAEGKRFTMQGSSVSHQGSSISSAGVVELKAAENMYNTGSKIAGDTGTITAQKLISEATVDSSHIDTKYTVKDALSKHTKTTSDDTSTVNKSTLAFANGYTVNGNAYLKATDTVGVGVYNGNTVIASAVEGSAHNESARGKNVLRFKNTDDGYARTSVVSGNIDPQNVYNGALARELAKSTYNEYHTKQQGFTKEAVMLAGAVTTIATAGAGASLGAAAVGMLGAEGAAASAVAGATSAAFGATSSQFAMGVARNDGRIDAALKESFGKDGLKSIAANSVGAGITSGIVHRMGVSVDAQTLKPINSTDIAHRTAYAGVQATVKTGVDAALLAQKGEFLNNLRDSFGTQAHAATSSAIGSAYMEGALNYAQHKAAHALAGTAYGLATNSNVLA